MDLVNKTILFCSHAATSPTDVLLFWVLVPLACQKPLDPGPEAVPLVVEGHQTLGYQVFRATLLFSWLSSIRGGTPRRSFARVGAAGPRRRVSPQSIVEFGFDGVQQEVLPGNFRMSLEKIFQPGGNALLRLFVASRPASVVLIAWGQHFHVPFRTESPKPSFLCAAIPVPSKAPTGVSRRHALAFQF
jgi:hypothetical protein